MRKRHRLAAVARASFLAGAGALGWVALGATGASAAEVPTDAGLLGSVSDVVNTASAGVAPATSTVPGLPGLVPGAAPRATPSPHASGTTQPTQPVEAPAGVLPPVADVVAQVPQLASKPTGTVLAPVTALVDNVVVQVPIVQSIVPDGTVSDVTAPITGAVDGTVGSITTPTLGAINPVVEVINPVVDPVLDVVDPVVDPVLEVVDPVLDVVDPVVPGVAPAPEAVVPETLVPAVPAGSVPDASSAVDSDAGFGSGTGTGTGTGTGAGTGVIASAVAVDAPAVRPVPAADHHDRVAVRPVTSSRTAQLFAAPAGSVDSVVLPVLADLAQAIYDGPYDRPELPAAPLASSGGALSLMTGTGAAAPLAALSGAALLALMVLTGHGGRDAAAHLPAGPSFDPGSTPD